LQQTCPGCEFLEVFRQVRVWNRKSAGRARVGMVCGAGAGYKECECECECGAGVDKNFNPRRTLVFISELIILKVCGCWWKGQI